MVDPLVRMEAAVADGYRIEWEALASVPVRKLKLPLGASRRVLKDLGLASFKTRRCEAPPSRRFTVGKPKDRCRVELI